jgi:hypothetical protein
MADRVELAKQVNERLAELHEIWRRNHQSMDVFLRREIDKHASEEMLGKLLADVESEIHKHKR